MRGQNVSLRTVLKNDSDSYFKWINDKELVLNNGNYKPISKEDHDAWFKKMLLEQDERTFSIVENKHEHLIGTCSLRNINLTHQNAELQIRIGERDYQNRGLGTETINLLVEYGFTQLNLKRIFLHVFSHNIRAIKAYEKCLFDYEGTLRKSACINGQFIDVNIMARLND
jgi:RimJ/RimL family protein N-acetyltransferase